MIEFKQSVNQSYEKYLDSLEAGDNYSYVNIFNKKDKFSQKCSWLSNTVFKIITDDSDLDIKFGKTIYDVMRSILNNKTHEYIKQEPNYSNFIIVCNFLDSYGLIDWGISIRCCWFNKDKKSYVEYLLNDFFNK